MRTEADRALTPMEAQMISGEWADPDRGKVLLGDYARTWIKERPGLRPKHGRALHLAVGPAHRPWPGRRCRGQADDADLREQLIELDGGDMVLALPKSRAGKRTVSIPSAIVPALAEHPTDKFAGQADEAFVFLGKRGAYLCGGNFRARGQVGGSAQGDGRQEPPLHDLRHTGNTLAAQSGASLADLKARMCHESDRAALIYQHATRRPEDRRCPQRASRGGARCRQELMAR
ncbi:tyrosine-type recombinase/integrase [Microbispora sp. ZYX-F-249]|uniref:Tyrosine-type recombinase/integrase n=1 Tax=Microbispora maris TaxID=3144104 RepID=A0ABV0AF38_9ACTN